MVTFNDSAARGKSTAPVPCEKPDLRLHTVSATPSGRSRNAPRPEVTRWKTKSGKVIEHDKTTGLKTCWFQCSECAGWFMVRRTATIKAAWPSQCGQTCKDAAQRRINREAQRRRREKAKSGNYKIRTFNPGDWRDPYSQALSVMKRNADASPEAREAARTFIAEYEFDPLLDANGERIEWRDNYNVPVPPGFTEKGENWVEVPPDTRIESEREKDFQALMTELRSRGVNVDRLRR